jgi:hypothetical protein
MNYDFFLGSLSSTLAKRFVECQEKLPRQVNEIYIQGVSGEGQVEVIDIVITVTKVRFSELAQLQTQGHDVQLFVERVWSELNEKPRKFLEPMVTDCIRKYNLFYDCAFIKSSTNSVVLNFRHSAKLLTQQPQAFAPLFQESFSQLQELIQGEYAITCPRASKPILATWHLAECVAFVAFNATNKFGILAHIDVEADIDDFFKAIKKPIKDFAERPLEIDYVLIGGKESEEKINHREKIKAAAQKANDCFFKFQFVKEIEELAPSDVFSKDSCWGTSMRLRRSVALDVRKDSPLQSLMSYEPGLNENSSLHKRTFTRFEAMLFERKREQERHLNLAYCSISKVTLETSSALDASTKTEAS